MPAIKIIGNISTGNENHLEDLIKYGIFDLAIKMLDHPKKAIRREISWILSNIAAGTPAQAEVFVGNLALLNAIGTVFHQDIVEVRC